MGRQHRDPEQSGRTTDGGDQSPARGNQDQGQRPAPLNVQDGQEQTWRDMGNLIGAPPVKDEGDQIGSGKPPNRGIIEDQGTYDTRRAAAESSLTLQRQRADAMLNEGYGRLDNRYWFSKVYSLVTENELLEAQNRTFYYPSYVMQSVRYFEKIYEDNVNAKDNSREVEEHWQEAFRVASDQGLDGNDLIDGVTGGLYRQVLSLVNSMKAHIRYDLPRAEAWVFNSYYAHMENADIEDFREDFNAMMGVFERAGAAMNEEIDRHNLLPAASAMPRMLQDFSMKWWFGADMATERADTWERSRMLVQEGLAGDDPYSESGDGHLNGDVTTDDNMSNLQELSDTNLRPSMQHGAEMKSDNEVREDVSNKTDAQIAAIPTGERIRMIRAMLTGATFDGDEDSIIRILNASTDMVPLIDGANAWDILHKMNGTQFNQVRAIFRQRYYGEVSQTVALTYLRRLIDGQTAEWEEQMILDILEKRSDARPLITQIGQLYEGGGFQEGLLELEEQLDFADQTRLRNLFGASGISSGDTAIRERVANSSAAQVDAITVEQRVAMIRRLRQGATLNGDERTILSLLNSALRSGDLIAVLDQADARAIATDIHGAEWTQLKAFYKQHYYPRTNVNNAFRIIVTCLNGHTAEWEEEMIADLLCLRSDGRTLLTRIGQHYEGGGFTEGLIKIEWQLDGADQRRIKNKFGSSGYWFADSAIRDRVNAMNRQALDNLGTNEKAAMIGRLLEGSTTNPDENVILKMLQASARKGDVVRVIDGIGAHDLARNMHGSQWASTKSILRRHYYSQTSQGTAFDLIRFCFDGQTAEWEEEMVADILVYRRSKDGRALISRLGRHYDNGGFSDGLNKVEWQLDGTDQDRVERAYGTSGSFW